jgi:MFS family permease
MTRDFSEFRRNWRPFMACFVGMASALSVNNFITSTFAPYLLEEFGWTRSQWAMTGMIVILVAICVPVAGRLADMYGVRRVAGVGVAVFPLTLVAIAMMNGDIRVYLAIYVVQTIFGTATTATIWTRLVAGPFETWRGLALALCAGSPALVGAIGAPLMTEFVADHGWRAGYLVVAAYCAAAGAIALFLTPPHERAAQPGKNADEARALGVYRAIGASPVFWMMLAGSFLVSIHHTLVVVQMKMLLLEQGASDVGAAWLISLFAGGVIAGRIVSGLALDFLPAHWVAMVFLGLPAIGMFLFASNMDGLPVLALGILLVGLAFGGEGDIVAYMVVRFFGIEVYSTVLGLLTTAIAAASAIGAALLSVSLSMTDSFNAYLVFSGCGILLGSVLFLMLGAARYQRLALVR